MHDNAQGWRTGSIVCFRTVLRIGFATVVPSLSLTVWSFSLEPYNDTSILRIIP
jgi:hypothetical protein